MQGVHVDALKGRAHPHVGALTCLIGQFRRVQHGFGRDAAVVEACAPELVAFDQGDAEPELGPAQSGRIPGAAGTEDDHVVQLFVVVHVMTPLRSVR